MGCSKILFVYPNKEGVAGIPVGIAVMSGFLKHFGHEVSLFDVTFMVERRIDHEMRETLGIVKKVDMGAYWGEFVPVDIEQEFRKRIISFKPDVIAFSIVENNYSCAANLIAIAKEYAARIVVGGCFPTAAKEYFGNEIVCSGEGEYFLLNLVNQGESKLPDCFFDWEPFVLPDWSIFDDRHLYRAFVGQVWRSGFFELSRGCPFSCGYCVNDFYRKAFKGLGNYHREKPLSYAIEEMATLKKQYNLNMASFVDESFARMGKERFYSFCSAYSRGVGLPFFMQTRATDIQDIETVRRLKEAGCVTIAMGAECGDEKFRRDVLSKPIANAMFKKAFYNCKKVGVRTTVNIILGLPFETEKNILESVEFCKRIEADSLGLAVFAPYHGTRLRQVCLDNGFIKNAYDEKISMTSDTLLDMPQLSREKILDYYYNFNNLVYGKDTSHASGLA